MAGSGVYRKKLSEQAAKTTEGIRWLATDLDQDISGVHPYEYRDDSVLRKDVHPNPYQPNGITPRGPYPVLGNQGYKREMTVVGPRAEEPLRPPKKFSPFGSSKASAKQPSRVTDQVYGVKLQLPPEAAEVPLLDMGAKAHEGRTSRRQAKKSTSHK